jgi:pimeloyl-ACP methyl ester carboxylesterase
MRSTLRLLLPLGLGAALLGLAAGCNGNDDYLTPERLGNGLVIILPGIEGESEFNHDIRKGLVRAGVSRAMPIHAWGRPIPLAGVLINQVDFLGNRLSGGTVARMITAYQDSHPGQPVHVIGHSGGGGVAVFAAEALPEGRQVDGLILLSASISSAYDLTKAAAHCRKGIVNFYNPEDTGLLGVGTIVMGTVDGTHGPSAGLIGFDKATARGNEKVFQVRVDGLDAIGDPHSAATGVSFVAANVAPWVLANAWPANSSFAEAPADPALAREPRQVASSGKPAPTPPPPSAPIAASQDVPRPPAQVTSPAAPSPSTWPSSAPSSAPAAAARRLGLAEAKDLVRKSLPKAPPDITLVDLTTEEIWQRLKAQVFRATGQGWEGGALFVRGQEVVPLGTSFGGLGATSLCVTDLNGDGKPELLFAYSWGSGAHRACLGILRPDRTPLTPTDLGIVFWGPGPDAEWMLRKPDNADDRQVDVLQATWQLARAALLPGRRLGTLRLHRASGRVVMDIADGLDPALKSRLRINPGAPLAFKPAPAPR